MGSELESKCLSDNNEMGKRYDVFVTTPKEGKHSSTFIDIIDNETIKRIVEFVTHSMYPSQYEMNNST
jgi:hypothetical protein